MVGQEPDIVLNPHVVLTVVEMCLHGLELLHEAFTKGHELGEDVDVLGQEAQKTGAEK